MDAFNSVYSSLGGIVFNKAQNALSLCPVGRTGIYAIPEGTTRIESGAFRGCIELTNIIVPDSLTDIQNAFTGCSGLISVTLGSGVTNIGRRAFSGCTSLRNIAIPDGVNSIDSQAFYDCASLPDITLPSSIMRIEDAAFHGCTTLSSVTIPYGVTGIGSAAFAGCSSLISVTIPDSVGNISDYSFASCWNLPQVDIPDSVTGIGFGAFASCIALTSATLGKNVTSIGGEAFNGCISMTALFSRGNAPSISDGRPPFDSSVSAITVYYLPGTTGWGATFAGRPTAMWIPVIPNLASVTADEPLKLLTHPPAPASVRVQRSADLRDWEEWQTVTREGGPSELQDDEAATRPYRFYRGIEE